MRYLLLLFSAPDAGPAPGSPEEAAEMPQWFAVTEEMAQAGVMQGGEALQPVETATTVRVRDGKVSATDGPFAETKEHLGGFWILELPDLDTALALAAKGSKACRGPVEVRPFQDEPPTA